MWLPPSSFPLRIFNLSGVQFYMVLCIFFVGSKSVFAGVFLWTPLCPLKHPLIIRSSCSYIDYHRPVKHYISVSSTGDCIPLVDLSHIMWLLSLKKKGNSKYIIKYTDIHTISHLSPQGQVQSQISLVRINIYIHVTFHSEGNMEKIGYITQQPL